MSIRAAIGFGILIVAAAFAGTAWAWVHIPANALIATHWDLHNHVNGYMRKMPGLLISPVLMVGISLLFLVIMRIEPRKNNLARSRGLLLVGWLGALAIMALGQGMIVATAFGIHTTAGALILPAMGLFFIVIGNAMPKSRSNFFAGIRTPWTLESDYSWEKTHRWTGRLFILTGIATLLAAALFGEIVSIIVLGAGAIGSALAGIVLSYIFWSRDPERHAHDSVPE